MYDIPAIIKLLETIVWIPEYEDKQNALGDLIINLKLSIKD